MIKFRSREEIKQERLNLVPIMDAVFIFIFFLLFSAQFIELVLLEAEAPVVSTVSSPQDIKEEPLNLNIKIKQGRLEVYTGIVPSLNFKVFLDEKNAYLSLKKRLAELRTQYPKEDELIISPLANTSYEQVVKVIEASQVVPKGMNLTILKDGRNVTLRKIVLEPLE